MRTDLNLASGLWLDLMVLKVFSTLNESGAGQGPCTGAGGLQSAADGGVTLLRRCQLAVLSQLHGSKDLHKAKLVSTEKHP